MSLPDALRGDGPCRDCDTPDNIVWFTDNVLWNEVVRRPNDGQCGILCIPCFIVRVDAAGLVPTGWRLTPEWPWREREQAK
jgi:hypothetical protein